MLNLRSSCKFLRTFCVLLAAWMAMEISCLAQAQPAEENAAFDPSYFDPKIFFALGMIESGNNDRGIGRAAAVSRFQIPPAASRSNSNSRDYRNPELPLPV